MARKQAFVGVQRTGKREVFMFAGVPTQESHGSLYAYCTGPYFTKSDAQYFVDNKLYLSPVALTPLEVNLRRKADEVSGQDSPLLVDSRQETQTCSAEGCQHASKVTVETWLTTSGYLTRWECPQCHKAHYRFAVRV